MFLTEYQKFVVSNFELCFLIRSLSEIALKKISKDEVIALTLEYPAKIQFNRS